MSLENRVATLEEELKVLKNQIQGALLEIQEQVLIHYYPALRAQRPVPAELLAPVPEVVLDDDDEDDTAGGTAGAPALRTVSLEEVRSTQLAPPAPAATDDATATACQEDGRARFAGLVEWVEETTATIGRARTGQIVGIYTDSGHLDARSGSTLLRLISMCDEDQPPAPLTGAELAPLFLELNQLLNCDADIEGLLALLAEDNIGEDDHNAAHDHGGRRGSGTGV